ncbi:MAG: hypothetical protein ACOC2U_02280, partial [bacterium]
MKLSIYSKFIFLLIIFSLFTSITFAYDETQYITGDFPKLHTPGMCKGSGGTTYFNLYGKPISSKVIGCVVDDNTGAWVNNNYVFYSNSWAEYVFPGVPYKGHSRYCRKWWGSLVNAIDISHYLKLGRNKVYVRQYGKPNREPNACVSIEVYYLDGPDTSPEDCRDAKNWLDDYKVKNNDN